MAFYEKPLVKFERLLETYGGYAPRGFRSFLMSMPLWLRPKLHLPREMDRGLGGAYHGRYVFTDHHESHAASAFFPSPFEEAAILTVDGVGEWTTASFGVGRENKIELTHELRFPHSLGLLYSAFTYFTGFKVNSGEYKLMGLSPYGQPRFKDVILERLIDLKDDGSFRMDMSYFNYCEGLTMTGPKVNDLLEGPPRRPESALTEREIDIAASIQAVTEEIVLRMARHVSRTTGMRHLVLAGGGLNCVANGRVVKEGIFDRLWIQPAAGDAGGALGAALFIWHQLLEQPRHSDGERDRQHASLLGPRFDGSEIRTFLDGIGAPYHQTPDEHELAERLSEEISAGKVIGLFQGRMEFGPRALDARSSEMQSVMNLKIKFRESFRPFAPCVLREHAHEWFDIRPTDDSPYMLLVAGVHPDKQLSVSENGDTPRGMAGLLGVARSVIPAVTHVDRSARLQTIDREGQNRLHQPIKAFGDRTGCPVIINTSFNIHGELILCSPEDAYRCFMVTNMDVLVLEDCVLFKHEQPQAEAHEIEQHLGGALSLTSGLEKGVPRQHGLD